MNVTLIPARRTRIAESTAPPVWGSPADSFKAVLKAMVEPASKGTPAQTPAILQSPDRIVVSQGDCLSRICSEQLKRMGMAASQREICSAVREVAKANHIVDPDRIYVGQRLDLSTLTAPGQAAPGQAAPGPAGDSAAPATSAEDAKPWKALVDGAAALSSGFGLRKDPFTGQMNQHDGIDVAAPMGASIRAFAAGSVTFSGWKAGYGTTVVVRHENGVESIYGHLSKSLVQVGEQVACHMPIACVGSTGRSTGAHLHFEVRKNGRAMDPVPLLNRDSLETT